MEQVRVGLVGSGFMGRSYAECLKRHVSGGTLAAIHGGARGPALAADYEVPLEATLDSLLARADVDAVLVATPHSVHRDQVCRAAAAGKHVLVEKPMALNAQECDEMIAACRRAGVTLSVIQTVRFRGTVSRAHRLIREGAIGEVQMIDLRTLFPYVPIQGQTWSQQESEGGLILDQGAHNFDFLRWYAGCEAEYVFGCVRQFREQNYPSPTAMVQVEFSNGILAQTWMSFELPKPGLPLSAFRALVSGTRGMLDIDEYGKLHAALDGGDWEMVWEQPTIDYTHRPLDPVRLEAFYLQVQDFVDAIRFQRPPAVTGEDARATIALIDAVRTSSTTRSAIRLPG
jgi:predicted dehydrogenase